MRLTSHSSENGAENSAGQSVRRKRTWYRRRLRIRRALLTAGMVLVLVAVCWQSIARRLALPTLHTSTFLPESFLARGDVRKKLSLMSQAGIVHVSRASQGTYPYSVIPGGVRDVADLRERAARDYVVRRHFAGFNYHRAHLVRADRAREVYLSYRIRDRIFWTRNRVRLRHAELLLTDGAITARARCGNQVSDTPKADVSDEEPTEDVLDQPVAQVPALGPFHFVNVHPNLPAASATPPSGPLLFAGVPHFPYVDFSLPGTHLCKPGDVMKDGHCRHPHKPPSVPEPASLLLIGTGLALVYWRYRQVTFSA